MRCPGEVGVRCKSPGAARRNRWNGTVTLIACLTLAAASANGDDDLAQSFARQIQPLLVKTCGNCHGKVPTDNELDLTSFGNAQAILSKPKMLGDVAERLRLGDMPPKDAPQPTEAEREQLLDWINAALDAEAAARAGDPGPVTLRRLSNTEYDNAIRDLTNVDMRPTQAREFPVDSVGGEGFANVGDAMPVTPELVERYHQTARDVAARAVLLPSGFRFSPSTERPDWTEEALKPLRSFHARHAGPNGEPPLAAHLAATLKHRDRLTRDGAAAIAAVAAEEKLNATYLAALWAGLNGQSASAEVDSQTKRWREKATQIDAEKQRRQAAFQSAKKTIESQWASSKRVLAESKVAEGGSVPFESKVSVERGELLLLTVLPNDNHGADSTLIEWTIRETTGDQRTWSVADLVPNLLKGHPWSDKHEARWSFLETTSTPVFLTERRDSNAGRSELKSWSLGSEPSVFVNSAAEAVKVWTTLPARSVFVHPGPKRPVSVAWTSPISGELLVAGRVADAHPAGLDRRRRVRPRSSIMSAAVSLRAAARRTPETRRACGPRAHLGMPCWRAHARQPIGQAQPWPAHAPCRAARCSPATHWSNWTATSSRPANSPRRSVPASRCCSVNWSRSPTSHRRSCAAQVSACASRSTR